MMAQWIDVRYGIERLDLGIVVISVYWAMVAKDEPNGYQYSYGGFKSNKLYKTMDEAKAAAIQSVDIRLAAARREIAEMRTGQVNPAE
jgi:hypothetical protein